MVELRAGAQSDAFYDALLADDAEVLYEDAPCGYLSTTPDGVITKVNGTFLAWTGWERAELVGQRHFVDLLSPGGQIYHETHYATSLRMHDRIREVAFDIMTADGRRLPALVNAVMDRGDDGTPRVIRIAVFDATERRRYERELLAAKEQAEAAKARASEIAQALQKTMLPPALPRVLGLAATGAFQPAGTGTELGGDFYDVFELGDGDLVAAIGDVCGKGIDAAAITALARHTIRAAAVRTSTATEILETVNQVLFHEQTDRYLTAVVVRLRRTDDGWATSMAIGGHPLPFLLRDGQPHPHGTYGGLVGLFEFATYHEVEGHLRPGDALVLYTDGITEARNGRRELFDEAGLAAVLRRPIRVEDIADTVLQDVITYQGGRGADDAAVLVLAPVAG